MNRIVEQMDDDLGICCRKKKSAALFERGIARTGVHEKAGIFLVDFDSKKIQHQKIFCRFQSNMLNGAEPLQGKCNGIRLRRDGLDLYLRFGKSGSRVNGQLGKNRSHSVTGSKSFLEIRNTLSGDVLSRYCIRKSRSSGPPCSGPNFPIFSTIVFFKRINGPMK